MSNFEKIEILINEVQKQKDILKNAIYKNEEAYWKSLRKVAKIYLKEIKNENITEAKLDKLIIEIHNDKNCLKIA